MHSFFKFNQFRMIQPISDSTPCDHQNRPTPVVTSYAHVHPERPLQSRSFHTWHDRPATHPAPGTGMRSPPLGRPGRHLPSDAHTSSA